MKNYPINLKEVKKACKNIYKYLKPSPLNYYKSLSDIIGANIYVKHENTNPTGSFKIRGGINLLSKLKKEKVKGVITFSTGNHGISIATAAKWVGIDATVVVPEGSNPQKIKIIEDCGAELIIKGKNFEEAAQVVEELSKERGLYFAHAANEPNLINGVGSEFLEIYNDLKDIDAIILPIGGGSELAAAVTVLKKLKPEIEIYAVQAEKSSANYKSWQSGKIETSTNETFAGGFATGTAFELPFSIYKDNLTDFVTLTEEEIYKGIALAGYYTKNFVEGAGSSTIMAALKLKERLKGKNVVIQYSGSNATPQEILKAYSLDEFKVGITNP